MSYLQSFLRSFTTSIPRIQVLANRIESKNNLLVNYPILLKPTSSKRLAIYSEDRIPKGHDILLLSNGQCIFSSGFTGASQSQQMQITEQMEALSAQYDVLNKDLMQRIKIYIQLLASSQDLKKGDMPLRQYAQYVLYSPEKGLVKSQINSRYLLSLYETWQRSNRITYEYMQKDLLKRTEEEQFLNACQKGRSVIRNAGDSPYLFAAPFLDKLDHSARPNCHFQMIYMPHRRSPFIRIITTRQISPGEKVTINYGRLSNYQLLMRYGFCLKNNPYSVFMLPLNFENIIQIFNKNIEWKQQQLLSRNMKLKNYVKILPSGELGKEDMLMMRILICDGQKPSQDRLQSAEFDETINAFVSDHAKNMRKQIKINNLHVTANPEIKNLQDEEIAILDKYIEKHSS